MGIVLDISPALDRSLEARVCWAKITYTERRTAKRAARRLNREIGVHVIRCYRCWFCRAYHVGHFRHVERGSEDVANN